MGTLCVAFVLDCHSRRIPGWRATTSMKTEPVLDALEQAIPTRGREGVTDLYGLVCHNDAGWRPAAVPGHERHAALDNVRLRVRCDSQARRSTTAFSWESSSWPRDG